MQVLEARSTRIAVMVMAVAAVLIAAGQLWSAFGATYAVFWYTNPSLGESEISLTSEVTELWTVNGAAGEEVVIDMEAGLWIFEVIRPTPSREGRVSVNYQTSRSGGSWSGGEYRIIQVGDRGPSDSDYTTIPEGQVRLSVDPHTDWTILIKPIPCPCP